MPFRLLLVLLLFVAVACDNQMTEVTTTVVAPESTVTTAVETTLAPSTTTLPPGTEILPEEMRAELGELIRLTEEIRGLEFLHQPAIVVVSDSELAQRVRDQLAEDLEDLPADETLYRLLGLIGADTDLAQLYTDLYAEQVAGFYDGEAGELVVPAAEDGFTTVQRSTVLHELVHALADQHYDFFSRWMEMIDADRYDEASAYRAFFEGDAVLAEIRYVQQLPPEEQAQYLAESFEVETPLLDTAPRFIRDALIFPYLSGFSFVDHLYRQGGHEAIGAAYLDPPVSTEQIFDPSGFPAEAPVDVEAMDVTIDGFDLAYRSTWGELGFRLMFDQVLGEDISATAAGGWGGDTYHLLYDGSEAVFVLHYRGDSVGDATQMGSALDQYVLAAMDVDETSEYGEGVAYRGNDHAWVRVDGQDVYFVATTTTGAFEPAVAAVVPPLEDRDSDG